MAAPQLANGSTVGIGSLPHRDLEPAIEFALGATVIPTIPTLPKRSPAEGMVVQSVLGIEGITVGQYGAISVDASRIDPLHPVTTDLQHDAFGLWSPDAIVVELTYVGLHWRRRSRLLVSHGNSLAVLLEEKRPRATLTWVQDEECLDLVGSGQQLAYPQ